MNLSVDTLLLWPASPFHKLSYLFTGSYSQEKKGREKGGRKQSKSLRNKNFKLRLIITEVQTLQGTNEYSSTPQRRTASP